MSRRIVRSQQVTDPPHDTSFCDEQPENWGKIPECPIPQFAGGFPQVKVVKFTNALAYEIYFFGGCWFQFAESCVADLDVGDWADDNLPLWTSATFHSLYAACQL